MVDLLLTAFFSGLKDGFNPCVFTALSVLLAAVLWFKRKSYGQGQAVNAFFFAYTMGFIFFTFGPGQKLILTPDFDLAARFVYFVLGVVAFAGGIVFLKDWFFLYSDPLTMPAERKKKGGVAAVLALIVAALGLSALATIWPPDRYIFILVNASLIKGQWQGLPIVVGYILGSIWPLWFGALFLSIKGFQASLIRIVFSSVFFTASSSVILAFKR